MATKISARFVRTGVVAAGVGAAVAGCATPATRVDPMSDAPAVEPAPRPRVVGASGPLSARTSEAVLARLQAEAAGSDMLQRHLAIEEAAAGTPLVVGNRVTLLRDGETTFRAMFAAIRGAKDHVNLEYYILEDVESDGVMLSDLLLARRRAGVAINVIYDSFGSSDTPAEFFDRLREAGVTVLAFNPVNPLAVRGDYAPNNRDHRKLLIADGATGIVGGINLSTAYQSNSIGKSGSGGKAIEPDMEAWRDTALQIDGPAVADLQRLFVESWAKQKGPPPAPARYFPRIAPRGSEVVRILGSAPENAVPSFHVALLSAISHAEESVWLTNAYFIPTDAVATALRDAARRGIDVRLLLPGRSDSGFSLAAARSHYAAMLAAGVRIYEFGGAVLHAKSAVVDGVWSVIGSSNVDHRSVLYNDEVDAVVVGAATGREMRRLFEDSLKEAKAIDPESWAARPLTQRVKEAFTRLWEKLL